MQLVNTKRVIPDQWVLLDDAAHLPAHGDVIVPYRRWIDDRESMLARESRLGVKIEGSDEIEALLPDLVSLSLIVLEFAHFTDGRNYSNARLLRERYAFTGEIRAAGEVLRDQLYQLRRCGIDTFVLADDCDVEAFLRGLQDFSTVYQPAGDARPPAYRLRAAGAREIPWAVRPA